MATETVLFVGGGQDGKLLTLETPLRPRLKAYKFGPPPSLLSPPDLMAAFGIEEYELLPFRSDQVIRYVYATRGMTALDVFERLVEGYRKSKEN